VADSSDGRVAVRLDRDALERLRKDSGPLSISMPISHMESLTLEMEPFHVLNDDARLVRMSPTGEPQPLPQPNVTMFRGRVAGQPGSHAFLAMTDQGSANGYVTLDSGEQFVISQPAGLVAAGDSAGLTITRADGQSGFPEAATVCGVDHGLDRRLIKDLNVSVAGMPEPLLGAPQVAYVAVDGDQAFVDVFNGDVVAAENYVVQVIGAVSDIYIRDLDVRLILSFVRLWPDGGEPFGAHDIDGFANAWYDLYDPTPYNLIHLFSGRRDLGYGGIAYVSGPCVGFGFGISGLLLGSFPNPIQDPHLGNWDVIVVAHEMGHNMGTFHTHDGYDPPIDQCGSVGIHRRSEIMSYCHTTAGGTLNIDLRFSRRVQEVIANEVALGACLFFDCNANDTDDAADIGFGTSFDVNGNGVPDECEDCNDNGTLDSVDIGGGAADINGNGIPDTCEPDCNSNTFPDEYDVSDGDSFDVNGNLIPDECEPDCDDDNVADFVEILNDSTLDLDRNKVLESCQDCNANGVTDFIDLERQFNVFVSDRTANLVREFHATSGVAVRSLGTGLLNNPQDLVFGLDRQLYVSSTGTNQIIKINVDTGATSVFVSAGSGGLNSPAGLIFRPNGNLLVASQNNGSVLEFNGQTGAFVGAFVPSGSGGLAGPFGLAFGPGGDLFVSMPFKVMRFSGANGAFMGIFVNTGSGGLDMAKHIQFLPDGRLLVASFGTNQVLAYDATGAPLGVYSNGPGPDAVWGLRILSNGNVFAARGSGQIRILEYDITSGLYQRSFIRGDSVLVNPTSMAFRPASPTDCNGNRSVDSCDVLVLGMPDCNNNLVPDDCELSEPNADCNGNDLLDACECFAADAPLAFGSPAMNRYVSFFPSQVQCQAAVGLRVRFVDLPPPFEAHENTYMWVAAPEHLAGPSVPEDGKARLSCTPVFFDWSVVGQLSLYGEEIVPGAVYEIQAIDEGCDLQNPGSYSSPVSVSTITRWGDAAPPFNPPHPSAQPNFGDIAAIVDVFRNAPGPIEIFEADLAPGIVNETVNFADISIDVDAFRGLAYPFAGPAGCPAP